MAATIAQTYLAPGLVKIEAVFDGSSVSPSQKFQLPRPRTINVEFNLSQGLIILVADPGNGAIGNYAQLPTDDVRDDGSTDPNVGSVNLADRGFYYYGFLASGSPIGTVTLLATLEE